MREGSDNNWVSDGLTPVEISSLTFQIRGLNEDANENIFSKMNKMLSAWDRRHYS